MDFKRAIRLAINGKEDGYSYLYQNTYQKSYYVALKYMKNEDDALDILQDAYIKAFQNLAQLEDAEKFPSWFSKIVASKALDELKRKKALLFSQVETEDFNVEEAFQDDRIDSQPELSMDKSETERLVKEMIDTLSDEQRICIMMYYVEEMSVKEMAETLGVSENTVKSRLNYGRKNIKEKVLELEKKGTKLYSLTPFPFFLYLLLSDAKNASAAELPLASLMEGALAQGSAGAAGASVGAATAGTGAAGTATAGAGIGAGTAAGLGKAATGIAIKKVLLGIAAVIIIVGGTAGGVLAYNAYQENAAQEAAGQGGQNGQSSQADATENTDGIDNTDNAATGIAGGNGEQDSDTSVAISDSDSKTESNAASEETDDTDAENNAEAGAETEAPRQTYTYTDLDQIMYAKQTVNVRDLPSTDGEKLGSLTSAQEVHVTGQCNETGWYRIEYDSAIAYASGSYLTDERPASQPGLNADGLPVEGLWVNVCGHNLTGEAVLSLSQGPFPLPLLTLIDNGDGTYTLYMPNNHAGVRDGQMIHFDVAKSDELYWQLLLEGYHVDMVGGDDWSSCVGGYDEGCIHQYLVYK